MKKQFTAVLVLALASMLTTGYCENIVGSVPKTNPQVQQILKKNVVVNKPSQPAVTTSTAKPTAQSGVKPAAPKPAAPKPPVAAKSFLTKPPVPVKYMQAPNPQSFQAVVKEDYHLSVPTNFGSNPLANSPGTDGPMLLRVQDNALFMAVNVVDPTDTTSYNALEHLPSFEQKKVLVNWLFGTQGNLKCVASEYNGFYGNTMLVEAKQEANGKTYELLYSFPSAQVYNYLPTVLYSLNSFKPN